MNKYSLIVEERIEGQKDFFNKVVISIQGNTMVEIFSKLPLELNKHYEKHIDKLSNELRHSNLRDDDIPF